MLDIRVYFRSKGLRCPATYSAAEFYVSQLAIIPGKEEKCTKQVSWLCDQFTDSVEGKALEKAIEESERSADGFSNTQLVHYIILIFNPDKKLA